MTFDAMVTEIVVICFQISIFASLGTAQLHVLHIHEQL